MAGLATSTQRVYDTGSRQYNNFCNLYAIPNPFPVSEHILVHFASFIQGGVEGKFYQELFGGDTTHEFFQIYEGWGACGTI